MPRLERDAWSTVKLLEVSNTTKHPRPPSLPPPPLPSIPDPLVFFQQRIVWISAGDERVGFETSKTEDADLMYQAICILVDRCHT